MARALEDSCTVYKGSDGLDAWLAYPAELLEANQLHASLSLSRILEKHFPDSHDVVGNIGAVLLRLKEDDEAAKYLNRAVQLAPSDPIDTWNLARLYDFTGKNELADEWYQKALQLDWDPQRKREDTCTYAEFVEKKLRDTARACKLQKENCDLNEQTACPQSK
jgi:Tfp pilus assembly protein PilF